ncbi:MAG: phosphoribosylaminoimidazolesuccinocarboxamide synthase [Phycisphaeraceae bacterium]|nr:phosphoribosylaminoimidazolesuccinocarboxamide synthase [Phycisphaeraceae bacterium]
MATSCGSCSAYDTALFESRLSLPGRRRGKVRDVYDLPPDGEGRPRLLIVASDRLSAFDVVMPTPVPGKGRLLTAIAAFWLRWVEARGLSRTHLLSTDAGAVPASAFGPGDTPRESLLGRVMIARACRVVPVECVVRGYLEGSGWKDYQATGSVCGVPLPAGLRQCDRLPEPIFTPATKEEQGRHDENIPFVRAAAMVGEGLMLRLREASLAIYTAAAAHALERGIIIADTKFEFGIPIGADGRPASDEPILVDEALTPDSSRFWPADRYEPGRAQASFDKQFVREYLEGLVAAGTWDKRAPGPELPADVVAGTVARYEEAARRLTEWKKQSRRDQ